MWLSNWKVETISKINYFLLDKTLWRSVRRCLFFFELYMLTFLKLPFSYPPFIFLGCENWRRYSILGDHVALSQSVTQEPHTSEFLWLLIYKGGSWAPTSECGAWKLCLLMSNLGLCGCPPVGILCHVWVPIPWGVCIFMNKG